MVPNAVVRSERDTREHNMPKAKRVTSHYATPTSTAHAEVGR